MKILISILCTVFLCSILQVAWPEQRNPFANLLPEKTPPRPATLRDGDFDAENISLDDLIVQGVFWDTKTPQVIINGKVYREKDTIAEKNAEIIEIKKNTVSILYQGRIFLLSPKK